VITPRRFHFRNLNKTIARSTARRFVYVVIPMCRSRGETQVRRRRRVPLVASWHYLSKRGRDRSLRTRTFFSRANNNLATNLTLATYLATISPNGGGELIFASRAFHAYFSYDRTRINTRVHTHARTRVRMHILLPFSRQVSSRQVK